MSKRLPILRVVQVNTPHVERYVIEDQKQRVWTGNSFRSHSPALYATHSDAAKEVQTILKKNFEGVEPQRYVVPVCIEVFSHEPVEVAHVAKYLSRVSQLFLNTTDHGNGPSNSLVLPWIEWHRIEPSKELPYE